MSACKLRGPKTNLMRNKEFFEIQSKKHQENQNLTTNIWQLPWFRDKRKITYIGLWNLNPKHLTSWVFSLTSTWHFQNWRCQRCKDPFPKEVPFRNYWTFNLLVLQWITQGVFAHLSLPWSIGWVALSFLVRCRGCPAMVTPVQISLLVAPHPKTHTFSESLW